MASIKAPKASPEQVGDAIESVVEEKFPGIIKPEKFMYVGPPTKLLPRYTIYEGGLPTFLNEHLEKCPALKALFVPPSSITETQIQLADNNSVLAMFYKKVDEYFVKLSEVK